MTQEELAKKAGVGLRFIRELEQGKETLRIDKINQVLSLFGHKMIPGSERIIDPYEILMKHTTNNVRILLKDKTEKVGFIMEPVMEKDAIRAWKFISNKKAKQFQDTKDITLLEEIQHSDIEDIENIERL